MTTNHHTIAQLDHESAAASASLDALERTHPRYSRARRLAAHGISGLGRVRSDIMTSPGDARVRDLERVFAIQAQAKLNEVLARAGYTSAPPAGVREDQASYGSGFLAEGQRQGAGAQRMVRTADRRMTPVVARGTAGFRGFDAFDAFGPSSFGGQGISGLGDACTSTGAQVAQATLGAGAAVSTSFASGDLSNRVQAGSTAALPPVLSGKAAAIAASRGTTASAAPTAPAGMTAGQKGAIASSVILGFTSSVYSAVCAARGSQTATANANVGSAAATGAIALVQNARAGTLATGATPADAAAVAASAPAATATGTTPGASPTAAADNRTMYLVAGGVGVLALGLLIALRK